MNIAKPDCFDIDVKLCTILNERGFNSYNSLESLHKKYDAIYTANVLEHIKDDVEILKQINSKLNPDGHLAIYVPAFMFLYSRFNASISGQQQVAPYSQVIQA